MERPGLILWSGLGAVEAHFFAGDGAVGEIGGGAGSAEGDGSGRAPSLKIFRGLDIVLRARLAGNADGKGGGGNRARAEFGWRRRDRAAARGAVKALGFADGSSVC